MAKKSPDKSLKDQVIESTLVLAAQKDWGELSFNEIIEYSKADINEAAEYFDEKEDILIAYGRRVDARVKFNISFESGELSEREKIFDILMERFDVLNEDRSALLSILASFKSDPKQMIISLPHLGRSMGRVLEWAGVETNGVYGAARVAGLTAIYLYAVRAWKDDDSADMARTMSALDKALDMGESAANSFDDGLLTGLSDITSRFCNKNDSKN